MGEERIAKIEKNVDRTKAQEGCTKRVTLGMLKWRTEAKSESRKTGQITGRPYPHKVIQKGVCQDNFMLDVKITSFRIFMKTAGLGYIYIYRVDLGSGRVGVG